MHQSLLSFYHRSPTTALLSFSSVTPSLLSSSLFSSIYSTNRLFHSSSFSMSSSRKYDYDFAVIGGGSGGLAASKEAAKLLKQSNPSAKVACFDFVQPTQHGTKWGLGGTCVNVGCVPKKLFHHAGLLGKSAKEDAPQFGWKGTEGISHNWNELVTVVTNYIRSLNFSYRTSLRSAGVDYFDSYAHFVDAHTLAYKNNTKSGQITVDKVLIATGGRPDFGGIPGGEVAISSDDIFWSKKAPGKTLVIGSGYIGVECAGFLHHLGYDTTLMVRGQFMRKFDLQAAQQIGELMEREGMKFLLPAQPVSMKKINRKAPPAGLTPDANGLIHLPSDDKSIQRLLYPSGAIEIRSLTPGVRSKWEIPDGAIEVSYMINNDPSKKIHTEIFDSVLIATGRAAAVQDLHLDKIGVKLYRNKVLVDKSEQTTVNNIYCVGDAAIGVPEHGKDDNYLKNHANDRPELTPVAIQAGILLAKRLFGRSNELMQYHLIPSTVFSSPVEYGFIGYSEEEARLLYGSDNIEVYYSRFGNLEISPTHAEPVKNRSYAFTKDNLWAYQYTKQKKLEWNEVSIIEGNPVYIYEEKSASGEEPKKGYITARSKDDKGNYLYDIELEGGMVITNIDRSRIILQEEALASQDELFTKAICLAKLIVDKKNNEKVIGFHFIGPNAGEVTQGFSLGMSLGATKADFDRMIGIHPTAAEEFAVLSIQQSSGISPLKKAGCGGGTCG